MTTQFSSSHIEGQSTNRPSLFNDENYTFWKGRMKIFIQVTDYNIWTTIVNRPHIPTHIINDIITLKCERDWDDNDKKVAQLNAKVINVLYYALGINEFNRIFTCSSVKEIWHKLEVTHEGTIQVKESKINMLVHKYELFKMEHDESMSGMFIRFIDIINSLKYLGMNYSNSGLV